MFNVKRVLKYLTLTLAILVAVLSFSPAVALAEEDYLYLGGFPAGFVLNTTTVEVVGICDVVTSDGVSSPAKDAGIAAGDIIESINGISVNAATDINKIIATANDRCEVEVIREGESLKLTVTPAKELVSGGKRLGILVKDSISGIGTVTYIDPVNRKFASLGHPVTNLKNEFVEINSGTIFGSLIYDVKKGVRGTPGELKGAFESGTLIGEAKVNCDCGVYGTLNSGFDCSNLLKISKASLNEAQMGTAYIYSTIYGKEPEKYEISIVKVDKNNKDNRNFVIKVEDERLLDKTGGIVQGMSGSPIVQNGKLIGAVTHVYSIIWIPAMAIRHI